jgi:uncharacterized protein YdeI (BOF family)
MTQDCRYRRTPQLALPGLLVAVSVLGAAGCESQRMDQGTTVSDRVEVETRPDGSWVSLSGTITSVSPSEFVLDYGTGMITVEMDDWDYDGDASALLVNDDVVVYGYIDDGFFQERKIEASSVYVEDLGTYFYASGVDEEDVELSATTYATPMIEVSGTVTSISDTEVILDTGAGMLTVETAFMTYDPLDDVGFQQVDVGDRIRVLGDLHADLFEKTELVADTIVST